MVKRNVGVDKSFVEISVLVSVKVDKNLGVDEIRYPEEDNTFVLRSDFEISVVGSL